VNKHSVRLYLFQQKVSMQKPYQSIHAKT